MPFRRLLWFLIAVSAAPFGWSEVAQGQSAGGFSAGPGLEPSRTEVANPDAGLSPANEAGGDYRTKIISYKASPAFTQVREFIGTRLWVLDPGQFTVEQWWNGSFGAPRLLPGPNQDDQFFQTEIEIGVYKHVQVDIYANYEFTEDANGNYQVAKGGHSGVAAEVRIALGSYWGQIWGNPTLYFELTSQYYNSPRAEARLLLGGSVFTPKLLLATNLAFERNIFHDDASGIDYEIKCFIGLNYELVPDILRVGVEAVLGLDSHGISQLLPGGVQIGAQDAFPVALVGPSLVLMEPHKRFKVLAALLYGIADYDSPWQPTVIASTSF